MEGYIKISVNDSSAINPRALYNQFETFYVKVILTDSLFGYEIHGCDIYSPCYKEKFYTDGQGNMRFKISGRFKPLKKETSESITSLLSSNEIQAALTLVSVDNPIVKIDLGEYILSEGFSHDFKEKIFIFNATRKQNNF